MSMDHVIVYERQGYVFLSFFLGRARVYGLCSLARADVFCYVPRDHDFDVVNPSDDRHFRARLLLCFSNVQGQG